MLCLIAKNDSDRSIRGKSIPQPGNSIEIEVSDFR